MKKIILVVQLVKINKKIMTPSLSSFLFSLGAGFTVLLVIGIAIVIVSSNDRTARIN